MKFFAQPVLQILYALAVVLCCGTAAKAQGLYFDPATLSFPNTEAGSTSVAQQITVTNFDPTALNVTAVTPPANPAFGVTHNCPVGTYQPFASCTIEVMFTAPNAAGPVQDVFQFESVTYGTQDIRLSGSSDGAPVVTTPVAVPTASEWALLLLTALLGGAAFFTARRNS